VAVVGSPPFKGLADLVDDGGALDVVLVHGMCTHDEGWAHDAIDLLLGAIDANLRPAAPRPEVGVARAVPEILVVKREHVVAGRTLRFTALVWSSLTTPLKRQLDFDRTGSPSNCAVDTECRPHRATVNGALKDRLLNDCLADALIYQGASRWAMQRAMVDALSQALAGAEPDAPLVLVSDSLGSKLVFDALASMLEGGSTAAARTAAASASARLAQVFMNANQLPILGLAEQDLFQPLAAAGEVSAAPVDSLQRYLQQRERFSELMIVAFTDPNDLLSYRLMPSRYASGNVRIADILVSNDRTYFGWLERPDTAHMDYDTNPRVARLIACGNPESSRCN
jgi:hypothetical protein